MIKIAVIGDVHLCFDARDVAYFNGSDYDLLLFVGDLANYRHRDGLEVARVMAGLRKTAVFIPGNHDTMTPLQLLAEIKQSRLWTRLLSFGQERRLAALRRAMGDVIVGGYSTHSFTFGDEALDVIAGRPLAAGGSVLHYRPFLQRVCGVTDMPSSIARLRQCVDEARSDRLIFLAHNGPYGLGVRRADIWGCDFLPGEGDFGDVDLQMTVAYARERGKQVLAVFGGHMHHNVKGGEQRCWCVDQGNVLYVNAARVPRIFTENGRVHHHHVCCLIETMGDGETAVQVSQQIVAPN